MNKNVRRIATLIMTIVMVVALNKNVFAETYTWNATKIPGVQIGEDLKEIPHYKGKMTFKVTGLHGNCSYLLAKCVSYNNSRYYINNTSRSVMITRVNGEQSFYVKFNYNDDYMYLICSVEHNASIGELVSASGIIYY